MKKTIITAAFLLIGGIIIAQDKKPTDTLVQKTENPADWPKDQDALIADKKHHKLLLENDSVRVLEVTILPGEKEAVHHHQWPSVLYAMEGEAFIERDGKGNVIFDSRKVPSTVKPPFAEWDGPEGPHSVENISKTTPIRLIRVEIKK